MQTAHPILTIGAMTTMICLSDPWRLGLKQHNNVNKEKEDDNEANNR